MGRGGSQPLSSWTTRGGGGHGAGGVGGKGWGGGGQVGWGGVGVGVGGTNFHHPGRVRIGKQAKNRLAEVMRIIYAPGGTNQDARHEEKCLLGLGNPDQELLAAI